MDYAKIKGIFEGKVFDNIQNLINRPTLDLYIANYTGVDTSIDVTDPYDTEVVDMTNVSTDGLLFIKNVPCIYSYDKTLIQQNDSELGTINSLTIYMRFADVPEVVLDNKISVVIKFNGIEYKSIELQNMYDIIIQTSLKN